MTDKNKDALDALEEIRLYAISEEKRDRFEREFDAIRNATKNRK